MSALRTWRIVCNGRNGATGCYRRYQPPADAKPRQTDNPSQLRRLAAKDGWTHVRDSNFGRRYDSDYCPDHKPAEESD